MLEVLLVDDEPFIRQGLSLLIDWNSYGYNIKNTASNGIEAIEILQKEKFDVIIIDIRMPEMDGITLIKNIREKQLSKAEIIILSGYYEFEYAKEAIRYNVTDYVLKPVQKEELIKILDEISRKIKKITTAEKESEQILFERNIIPIIWGKYDDVNIEKSKKYLKYAKKYRYINIELSPYDEKFCKLSENEKRNVQRKLFDKCKETIQLDNYHFVLDVTKDKKSFDIGFIFTNILLSENNMTENEYINKLAELLNGFEYKLLFCVGKMVENITEISESYKTADLMNMVENVKKTPVENNVYFYEEASMGVIGKIVKDVEENYMQSISLKGYGEKYFINSAYLGQLFKKKFGKSFKEYLNNFRIEKACELLEKTDKKIYIVAEEVGYNNIDYFTNRFVEVKGKTPYQYRKDYLKVKKM